MVFETQDLLNSILSSDVEKCDDFPFQNGERQGVVALNVQSRWMRPIIFRTRFQLLHHNVPLTPFSAPRKPWLAALSRVSCMGPCLTCRSPLSIKPKKKKKGLVMHTTTLLPGLPSPFLLRDVSEQATIRQPPLDRQREAFLQFPLNISILNSNTGRALVCRLCFPRFRVSKVLYSTYIIHITLDIIAM